MRLFASFVVAAGIIATPARADELRNGGKLLLTDGVTSVEGAAGGGLASWAVIGGRATDAGIGAGGTATYVHTGQFDLTSIGAKFGFFDRVELSYANQSFDTRKAGEQLGLGRGFTLEQHVFGAKVRLLGDAVYGDPWMPQVSIGVQHKRAGEGWLLRAVGAHATRGTDFYVAATKVVLQHGAVVNATARLTKANQFGLLGFGGDRNNDYSIQFEGSVGKLVTRRLVIGAEYRTRPDNLGFAEEGDAFDLFAAYAVHRNFSVTAAYVDLGSIATFDDQRGVFLSLQGAF
jgi:hypothetical protein